ncbi:MAG: 16S rRNA (guanine(966)-N(2))-methyltransferase RsmD [Cellvibrionales bacterium TMED49]|nr:16S rRNA (guanine(966)-N(2))-methyltransferase RsmD [Porticoccaceae bacterium]OUU38653.1 MAG: 16S rRNA (guanine(966)-N(2))-methyltransferase RsmD [Cellvibrionales bacterium TMED49]|tara:strand:- start:601 stop:1194 length:594 start_codon:yes stop_codon:yes gene_type:complete
MKKGGNKRRVRNEVRIIGGRLRGRVIEFENSNNIRPTGNRSREQLFDWLGPVIQGADCADLFAGSGALSFEALSRGATRCLSIDINSRAVRSLRHNAQKMDGSKIKVINSDSWRLAKKFARLPFDLIFIDPPFSDNYVCDLCLDLEANCWLKAVAYIYIEAPVKRDLLQVPTNWELWRQDVTGKVKSLLYKRVETDR